MSKLQSKDFLNISCIVEDNSNDDNDRYLKPGVSKGYIGYMQRVQPIIQKHDRAAMSKIKLGTLIGGGIGYYLGKNNEYTHSLYDKIVNMFKHHES
jgi:hypothetical protein